MDMRWVGGGLLLLGLVTLVFGAWFAYSSERAADWLAVQGEVERVDIRRYHPQGQTGLSSEQRERYVEYYPQIH